MSQYKISKARLAQIIKEEYQSLHESNPLNQGPKNALMKNINRWAKEGEDIPKHLTVGRMSGDRVSLHRLQGMLYSLQDDFVPYLDGTEEHEMYELVKNLMGMIRSRAAELSPGQRNEALTGGQKEMDEDDDGDIDEDDLAAKRAKKKVKKESLATIRDLIQQELQNR
jgi:hypothetical protein